LRRLDFAGRVRQRRRDHGQRGQRRRQPVGHLHQRRRLVGRRRRRLGNGRQPVDAQADERLHLLDYALYTDSGRTTIWGDGTDGATIDDTGTGSAQAKTIYGTVLAGQPGVPAGSYADTVAVTVTY